MLIMKLHLKDKSCKERFTRRTGEFTQLDR